MNDVTLALTTPHDGGEPFRTGGEPTGFDLQGFWRWAQSDLLSNVTRGVLAEYIVAQALGVAAPVRDEWAAFDLQAPGNPSIRVEVKCSAYVQGWRQDGFTKPQFDTAPSRNLDDPGSDPEHQADVYVYCLLAHRNRETVDPLDLDQWEFYVLPRSTVEELSQKSVGLSRLRDLTLPVPYVALRTAIYSAAMGRLTSPANG